MEIIVLHINVYEKEDGSYEFYSHTNKKDAERIGKASEKVFLGTHKVTLKKANKK